MNTLKFKKNVLKCMLFCSLRFLDRFLGKCAGAWHCACDTGGPNKMSVVIIHGNPTIDIGVH